MAARVAPADDSFRQLTAPYLAELHLHCYRMLGSLTDADDVLQEVLVAAWRGLAGFEGRASLRTWLYRIATNRCLNELRSRNRRPAEPVPPFDPPQPTRLGDVPWLQPYPDAELEPADRYQTRETIELAFVEALQRLPRRQVAVLLLCDVLEFPAAEVARMLDATPTAVKGLLQRARARVDRPAVNAAEAGDEPEKEIARRFADAYVRDDVAGVVALLTDDAWLAMPPAPHQYQGSRAIAAFLEASRRGRAPRRFVLVPTRANGHPAFGVYLPDADGAPAPVGILALAMSAGRIVRITRFLDVRLPARFGLRRADDAPDTLGALRPSDPAMGHGEGQEQAGDDEAEDDQQTGDVDELRPGRPVVLPCGVVGVTACAPARLLVHDPTTLRPHPE